MHDNYNNIGYIRILLGELSSNNYKPIIDGRTVKEVSCLLRKQVEKTVEWGLPGDGDGRMRNV